MLKAIQHRIPGVIELIPQKFEDDRGYFSEVYKKNVWEEHGIEVDFVQDNQSFSRTTGTLRGLHFQLRPFAQAKLLRVIEGAVFDVAVDIRSGSPSFGEWVGVELTAEKGNQLFIPVGFAHGFLTLKPNTKISYKVSNYYSKEFDRCCRFDDPAIGIEWPDVDMPIFLSEKDKSAPALNELNSCFVYGSEI